MAKKKIKIPRSVKELRLSARKFAKKHGISLKTKHMSKKEKKYAVKKLNHEYAEAMIGGLDKAVKILAENDEFKKADKVKAGVENIITNPDAMKRIIKIYKKNPDQYPSLKFLPAMIMNTLAYYTSSTSDEDKKIAESLDTEALVSFCEKILRKEIKRYKNKGLPQEIAFQLATVVPTTRLFKNNRGWYKRLINAMYDIGATTSVDIDTILKAVTALDKKKGVAKKDFLEGFFSEFIMTRTSNKQSKNFSDTQKDLRDGLIERTLVYMDGLKQRKLREMLKTYIKRRKKAESYKNDGNRVIKFIDHANSNSPYANIKDCVQQLIADNSENELYLG